MKNRRFSVLIFLIFIGLSICLYLFSISDNINSDKIPITISINCSNILSNYHQLDENLKNDRFVPKNGIILPKTRIYINRNGNVFDALKEATKEYNIHMEFVKSADNTYIEGINYIYEFSCGELSGWMYKVNGKVANIGCNGYVLYEGDNIEWVYTCDLGRDIK